MSDGVDQQGAKMGVVICVTHGNSLDHCSREEAIREYFQEEFAKENDDFIWMSDDKVEMIFFDKGKVKSDIREKT